MLQFIGIGSAFNTALGNNCAYIKNKDTLIMIDCGSTTFSRLMKREDLLHGIENIHVIITHTHADHIGSLADLILYSCFEMGEVGKPSLTVHVPQPICSDVIEVLTIMGTDQTHYNIEDIDVTGFIMLGKTPVSFTTLPTNHVKQIKSFAYVIRLGDHSIYYSGDSKEIPEAALTLLNLGIIDFFYQDTNASDVNSDFHLSYNKLCELVPQKMRNRVYCMHLDESFDRDAARKAGFQVVTSVVN